MTKKWKFLVVLSLVVDMLVVGAIYYVNEFHFDVAVKISEHMVISHEASRRAFKELHYKVLDTHPEHDYRVTNDE